MSSDENTFYFSAEAARKEVAKAKSLEGELHREKTLEILNLIRSEAKKGNTTLHIYTIIPEVVRARLTQLGYSVKYTFARNEDITSIYWHR